MITTNVSKDELENLYCRQGLSLKDIAKLIGVKSSTTVAAHLRRSSIQVRPSYRKNYVKLPFSGDILEKSYLLGLRAGDIYAFRKNRCVAIETTSSRLAQVRMIKNAFDKYGTVVVRETKGGITETTFRIGCYLDMTFDFLVEKPKEIPDWILNNRDCFLYFLAGYADCEGSWIITQHKKYNGKWKDPVFSLGTCDKNILEQIHRKLLELGFKSHFYLVRKAGVNTGVGICNFDLHRVMMMSRSDVAKLARILLPISHHGEKLHKMDEIIKIVDTPLPKRSVGTVDASCVYCGHNKIWKNGFKHQRGKLKTTIYKRYKCPSCKKDILETQIEFNDDINTLSVEKV